jgi:hypothetical protein
MSENKVFPNYSEIAEMKLDLNHAKMNTLIQLEAGKSDYFELVN